MAVISDRQLNRTTLARQHLLERSREQPLDVLRLLVGMQGQDPGLPHIGLWNRIAGFRPADLDTLLNQGRVARATLYRCTQHLLDTEDYAWVRPLLDTVVERLARTMLGQYVPGVDRGELTALTAKLLDGRTLSRPELGQALAARWPEHEGVWLARAAQVVLPIVHPYPDGTFGRRGTTPFALGEQWLGREFDRGRSAADLVLRYLAGFGPASVKDMQAWSGLTRMREVFEKLRPQLVTYRNEYGAELFDLPGRELAEEDRPAPVRFLPGFDNITFGYADRRRILADEHRTPLVGAAAFLCDGRVRGVWSVRGSAITVKPFTPLAERERTPIEAELEELRVFLGLDSAAVAAS